MASIDPLFYIIVALILIGLLIVLQPILSQNKNNSQKKFIPTGKPLPNALIVYGTQSGNSEMVASELQKQISKNGFAVDCRNLLNLSLSQLNNIEHLFMVVSTYGEGEMPPEAEDFYLSLKDSTDKLNLQYSICALGDSSYEHYCQSGIQFNQALKSLGAQAMFAMQKCDEDFTNEAQQWIIKSTQKLLQLVGSTAQVEISEASLSSNKQEYTATLVDRIILANDSNENTILHLSFEVNDQNFKYKAGDTIEVLPQNPKDLVRAIGEKLKVVDNLILPVLKHKELTNLSKKTLIAYSKIRHNKSLTQLIKNQTQLSEYLYKANVLDLLNDYPINAPVGKILDSIPSLKSRVYSIASSELVHPKQIDLCIKTIRYPFNNSDHEGAGSIHLNETIKVGETIQFILKPNPHFKLSNSTKPVIMIATGTGIAPFRSFVQEIAANKSERDTWLIWGQKYSANYADYHQEFKQQQSEGLLKEFTPCFSKEESTYSYVQDVLRTESEQLLNLINKGASIYLCGSQAMANGVKETLNTLLLDTPLQSISALVKQKRWFEDVY